MSVLNTSQEIALPLCQSIQKSKTLQLRILRCSGTWEAVVRWMDLSSQTTLWYKDSMYIFLWCIIKTSISIYHLLCYINVLKGFIVLWHPDALLLLLSYINSFYEKTTTHVWMRQQQFHWATFIGTKTDFEVSCGRERRIKNNLYIMERRGCQVNQQDEVF